MAHLALGLGLEEGILSGCGGYFSETVKENSKRAQLALVWSPPAEAGWAQVGRGGGKGEMWGVVLKHCSWSCVGNLMSLNVP